MKTIKFNFRLLATISMLAISILSVNAQNPVRFFLVDADSDSDIRELNTTDTVYYSNTHHISIRAEYYPYPDSAQYIDFIVNNDPYRSEGTPPFALQGDRSGDYLPYVPQSSEQVIRAKIGRYDIVGGILTEGFVSLLFIDTTGVIPQVPSITSFILVNADTDQDIGILQNGDNINISNLPPLNIRVTGNIPPTGSVTFNVGTYEYYKTENKAPYSVYGDINGDFQAGYLGPVDYPGLGVYSTFLTATPYSGPNGSGIQGQPVTIVYSVSFGLGNMKISVYPNPAQSDLYVTIDGNEPVELLLYDSMGKTYLTTKTNSSQASFDLDQLEVPKGYYFLKVIYPDDNVKVFQLVKN